MSHSTTALSSLSHKQHLSRKCSSGVMGALYEDVEKFFGDIFARYALYVVRYPFQFVVAPLLLCGLLGLGLLNLDYEFRVQKLYAPIDGQSVKDHAVLSALFPEDSNNGFYAHQQISCGSFGEVIITAKAGQVGSNSSSYVLSNEAFDEVVGLYEYVINNITVNHLNTSYSNVCAIRDDMCVVNGADFVELLQTRQCITESDLDDMQQGVNDPYYGISQIFANPELSSSGCIAAVEAIRLRFNLRENTDDDGGEYKLNREALQWEEQFLKALSQYKGIHIDITFIVSKSMDLDIRDHVGQDIRVFLYSVVAMLVYATVVGAGGNWVSNHVTLAFAGVFAALLAIVASFGFLSLCGMKFVNMCGVMPFLVIGIGVDDMFQLMTEWRQTNIRDTIELRLCATMRSAAVSITITSLTDILAFCIGATSPFISVKYFCACSGVAILLCYFNQLTFFSGCLVLHARRVSSGRHCLTCFPTTSREDMEDAGKHACRIMCCSGSTPYKLGDEGGICRPISKGFYRIYPKVLLHWITKTCVICLFCLYICVSVWGMTLLQKGFRFEEIIHKDSYLSTYLSKNRQHFPNNGPVVMFVVTEPVEYQKPTNVKNMERALQAAKSIRETIKGSEISWMEQFTKYLSRNNITFPKSETEFIKLLHHNFLRDYPQFQNDVKINHELGCIEASRFYVLCKDLTDSQEETKLLIEARNVANSSPLPMTAYSIKFPYYEQYVTVLKDTLLAVGVTMIGLLFVALVFIPHPIAVGCVTVSMISAVLGMVAFMAFWGLELSAITTIQIILCVAFCVDFTVHMSHAFMTATGKNRNERVTVALEKVGIPILNGAISSFLGISMLLLGDSYIFRAFFKTLILVQLLVLFHSVVFLPVMLSFVGPRRTSKPRVFIQVSHSVRSLQDTYRANSIVRPVANLDRLPKVSLMRQATIPSPIITRSHSFSEIEGSASFSTDCIGRRVSFAVGEEKNYNVDPKMLNIQMENGDVAKRSSDTSVRMHEMEVLLEQNEDTE